MRVYRGRADSIAGDRDASERLVDLVAEEREPAVRVWRPHRQLAFGRRDVRAEGYERARDIATEREFPPVERDVGGRAVAYTGATVAFARVTPVDDVRSGLTERYEAALADVRDALASLGVDASEGEPHDAFCPGTHSLQVAAAEGGERETVDGRESRATEGQNRKIAGIAQRVRRRAAVVAGVLVVRDHDAIASVIDPVYEALDVPFDPETVGSVALVGGEADPDAAVGAVESALVGEATARIQPVAGLDSV